MVTIRGNLDESLSRFVHKSIQGPLDELQACYACAGIRNNPSAARKARGNHYGEYYLTESGQAVSIPKRQFIWAAIKDIEDGNVGFTATEIKDLLVKKINSNPRVQKQSLVGTKNVGMITNAWGETSTVYKDIRHTDKRALPVVKGGNFDGLFEKLADKMEARLKDAILSVNIVGSNKPTIGGTTRVYRFDSKRGSGWGDIRSNAPSTIEKKGFDHPLIETGEMLDAIEGWTNGKGGN